MGIRIYDKIGEAEKIEQLIKENEEILNQTELNDFIKGRFQEVVNDVNK